MTMIVARLGGKSLLNGVERHIHGFVADRVNADPVAGAMIGVDRGVEFLRWNADQPTAAWIIGVGFAERRDAAGDAAIDGHLDAADLEPFIAEACFQSEVQHALRSDLGLDDPDQHTDAQGQPALGDEFLIGAHRFVVRHDIVDGGDAATQRALRRMDDAVLHLFIGVGRNGVAHEILRALNEFAGEFARRRVQFNRAAARGLRVFRHVGEFQRLAVGDRHMRAKADRHGVVRRHEVEFLAARKALLRHAKVLHRTARADDPGSRRHFARPLAHDFENMINGAHVRVEIAHVDVVKGRGAIVGEMHMRVGEARQDRATTQIDDLRARAAKRQNIVASADRENAPEFDRDGLALRVVGVSRQDAAIGENQIGSDGVLHDATPVIKEA
jgi:hypothetical protein